MARLENVIWSGLVAIAAVGTGAHAQDLPRIALSDPVLKENVGDGARISGAVVAGVQVRTADVDGITLRGFVPAAWKGETICAQVLSIDGLYEGLGAYTMPADWQGGLAQFEFPTRYSGRLTRAGDDELAVQLVRQGCGAAGIGEAGLALWNAEPLARIDILLNAFRADDVFVYVQGREAPVRCQPIASDSRTAFDTKCVVPSRDLAGRVELDIYRVDDGAPAPPDTLAVWFPGD